MIGDSSLVASITLSTEGDVYQWHRRIETITDVAETMFPNMLQCSLRCSCMIWRLTCSAVNILKSSNWCEDGHCSGGG